MHYNIADFKVDAVARAFDLFKLQFTQEELDTKFNNKTLDEIIKAAYTLGYEADKEDLLKAISNNRKLI